MNTTTYPLPVLPTGASRCYDSAGNEIPCAGSGQDAETLLPLTLDGPRFKAESGVVLDRLTGLAWLDMHEALDFPYTWSEALQLPQQLNAERAGGRDDWRLPNRRELRSLIHHEALKPALPPDHAFTSIRNVWYWTSTTSAMSRGYAWYVHFEGGRMFYGRKDQSYLVLPVSGRSSLLPATGAVRCYNDKGEETGCHGTRQDGELRCGVPWPEPRFHAEADIVRDGLTGLTWLRRADLAGRVTTWDEALTLIRELREAEGKPWRLPTINELESLVDAEYADPALSPHAGFTDTREAYWSSTTSFFDPSWSYCLYLHKGAVGVGFKVKQDFSVWPVFGPASDESRQ